MLQQKAMPIVGNWPQSLELLYLLVMKELRVRYKGSFLGYVWAVANPLLFTLVYYIAFKLILKVQIPYFGVYLVTGIFPWTWMASTLVRSAGAYRNNESLVKKVNLQRPVLPLSIALEEMMHFFFSVPVLIVAVIIATGTFRLSSFVLIPLVALVQLAMICPLAIILAATNMVVRDVEYLVGVTLQMLFFLTPIVFPESGIPPEYRPLFEANPFYYLIRAWRGVLYEGRLDLGAVGHCLLTAVIAAAVAWYVHKRFDSKIGELL